MGGGGCKKKKKKSRIEPGARRGAGLSVIKSQQRSWPILMKSAGGV